MTSVTELQIAIQAVQQAARFCEHIRHHLVPHTLEKNDRSPVTIADFGAQAIVGRALQENFPADPLIAEEDGAVLRQQQTMLEQITEAVRELWSDPSILAEQVLDWVDQGKTLGNTISPDRFWTLDPIDGTKGFLRGDQYAIALALVEQGEVKLGVLGCPALTLGQNTGVLFVAIRGQGTRQIPLTQDSISMDTAPVLQVVQGDQGDGFRFVESVESAHGDQTLQETIAAKVGITANSIRMDSQAKYGAVAAGEAALYLRLPSPKTPDYREKIWDHAAGVIVIEEAGGRVTDMHGQPLNFSLGKTLAQNQGIVASNGTIHDRVLQALAQFG